MDVEIYSLIVNGCGEIRCIEDVIPVTEPSRSDPQVRRKIIGKQILKASFRIEREGDVPCLHAPGIYRIGGQLGGEIEILLIKRKIDSTFGRGMDDRRERKER
jgi:hypothetical protein